MTRLRLPFASAVSAKTYLVTVAPRIQDYTDEQVAEAVKQGREFLDDCFPELDAMHPEELSDLDVLRGVQRHWDGGLIDLVSACYI